MKSYFLLIISMFLVKRLAAQNDSGCNYTITGKIDIDSGSIRLLPYLSHEYSRFDYGVQETKIANGKFSFSGLLHYPLAFRIRAGDYISGEFFIEPGTQQIICNKDSMRITPYVDNKVNKEFKTGYSRAFAIYTEETQKIDDRYDRLRDSNNKLSATLCVGQRKEIQLLDSLYLVCVKKYLKGFPSSYVMVEKAAAWLNNGYDPLQDSIYKFLPLAVKRSYLGKVYFKQLEAAKRTGIGNVFPTITVLDMGMKTTMLKKGRAHRFTLIDFWYSGCGPCIGQFPKFRETYSKYNRAYLEIIGISVDRTNAIDKWKEIIRVKQLGWPQYLDLDGKIAATLSISTYPRNFLLDENYVIIKKDILPEELDEILINSRK